MFGSKYFKADCHHSALLVYHLSTNKTAMTEWISEQLTAKTLWYNTSFQFQPGCIRYFKRHHIMRSIKINNALTISQQFFYQGIFPEKLLLQLVPTWPVVFWQNHCLIIKERYVVHKDNLVPRVSHLPVTWRGREDERPWERGWHKDTFSQIHGNSEQCTYQVL